jgi:hypothetical protein
VESWSNLCVPYLSSTRSVLIYISKALIHANNTHKDHLAHHKEIELSTCGIVFLGTPHLGSDIVSLARFLLQIQSVFSSTNDTLLRHLERDSEMLQLQLSQFASIIGRFDIKFFFEAYPTRLPGGVQRVVNFESASNDFFFSSTPN